MIPVLVAIWDGLLELLAGCRALFPMLGSLGGRIGLWMVALWGVIKTTLQQCVSWIGADTVETLAKGTLALGVRMLVLVAWGVFLAVVFTGIYGLSLQEVAFQNPFAGFPGAMMYLVNCAFPVKFACATITSYIIFRFTVVQAALVMSRTIKFIFGA